MTIITSNGLFEGADLGERPDEDDDPSDDGPAEGEIGDEDGG